MPEPGDLTGGRGPGLFPGSGAQGRSARAWRGLFVGVWLIYLVQPLVSAFQGRHGALYLAGVVATIAAFCVAYVLVMVIWERRVARIGLAVLVVLAVVDSLVYHGLGTWIFVWRPRASPRAETRASRSGPSWAPQRATASRPCSPTTRWGTSWAGCCRCSSSVSLWPGSAGRSP